ncbi:MAG: hypothetical protein ACR2OJ_11655 [Hyphomicrobiales bacterium]
MEVFVRHIKLLWNAERMLGEIKLKLLVNKIILLSVAALFGLFALAMINLACFFALEPRFGSAGAAALVAFGDLIITIMLAFIAQRLAPGNEAEIVNEVREMALADIESEARAVQGELRMVRDEIVGLRSTVTRIIEHPLEALAPKIAVPLIAAIMQLLKSSDTKKSSSSSSAKARKKTAEEKT